MDRLLAERAHLEQDLIAATDESDQIRIYGWLQENLSEISALQVAA